MKTMYRADYGATEPVEVLVDENPPIPALHRDAMGVRIMPHSHFESREACWQRMLADSAATIRIRSRQVIDARRVAAAAEKKVADALLLDMKLQDAFSDEQRASLQGKQ